ncbi:glycosyltransferase [Halomonas campisalis]|uniref:Glycosyltransferase n=1 Tax=Billgrantia campisalis TaxID=74661 RepID=A0ABS9P409_9GAMM|nr:glycosyltransferase [Halomonas campisalis]MCG6656336.1 glycosyltransferase [Halomonas campisalis]MDR5861522.1 glycosyltransferase [Halomonas campisalis]
MPKKPLAILTPKTYNGGAENVAAHLSRHFHENYDVSVLAFDTLRTDYEYAGTMVDLALPKVTGIIQRLYMLWQAVMKVRHYKKTVMPVACISLIGHPNLTNVLSRQGEFCVISVRTYMRRSPNFIKHFLQKQLVYQVYNRADKVVAICEGVRKDLVDYYGVNPNKIEVIYPYFHVAEIQKKSQELIEDEWHGVFSKPVIITAGRLTYDKGQWHLIKAFSLVKAEIPDAVLVILGRGEMEADLKHLAGRSGYSDDIHFMGYCNNPFKYISSASVFAFPSLIEGFGNALGEALACGTPAVACDCDVGPREILAPETDFHSKAQCIEQYPAGFLVPAFDETCDMETKIPTTVESDMANALLRVLQDDVLRKSMSSAASQRAWCFDTAPGTGRWDALLESN